MYELRVYEKLLSWLASGGVSFELLYRVFLSIISCTLCGVWHNLNLPHLEQ